MGLAASLDTFSPLRVPTLTGWYDFSDKSTMFTDTGRATPVAADADLIGSMADKSGGARHLTRGGIAGTEPSYKVNIQGGKSIARFNAAHWLVSGATYAADTKQTIIFAGNYPGGVTQYGTVTRSGSTNNRIQGEWNNGAASLAGALLGTGAGTYTEAWTTGLAAGWVVITILINSTGAVSQVYGNGVLRSSATGVPSIICDTAVAFGTRATNALASGLVGDLGEALIFSDALSSVNRYQAEMYLRNKWGAA